MKKLKEKVVLILIKLADKLDPNYIVCPEVYEKEVK